MAALWKHVGIVGAGSWGTALALVLDRNGLGVTVWGNDGAALHEIETRRENRQYLPGVPLPETLKFTSELKDLAESDLLLLVTPSRAFREVAQRLAKIPPAPGAVLLCCTKGVERGTGLRMSQILFETLPGHTVAVLSGPSHAEEVARRAPTAVVLGCEDPEVLGRLQSAFSNPVFRAYVSSDVTGIELGGALKNPFAIAAGVCDGLGLGDNTKAALVTRALAEMIRLGVALGGRVETFQGLGGIGDLMVTCFSRHSRNRSFGERLARGETAREIAATTKMVAEGVPNTFSAWECAQKLGIDTPIIEHVRLILEGKLSPSEALSSLLARDPRAE
jgi:glycerol-3-phosphate dehydrogenase (NAD(P)+)